MLRLPLHAKPPSRTPPRPATGLSGPVGTRWPGSHSWLWVLVPEPAGATRDLKASVSPSSRWRCLRAEDGAFTSGAGGDHACVVAGAGGPGDLAVRIPCELRGKGPGRGLSSLTSHLHRLACVEPHSGHTETFGASVRLPAVARVLDSEMQAQTHLGKEAMGHGTWDRDTMR